MKDPRHKYVLKADGKVVKVAPWSTVNMIAKHLVDCGKVVSIELVARDE